jgi:hypothetical protein
VIEGVGRGAMYIFDCLSSLAEAWKADPLLGVVGGCCYWAQGGGAPVTRPRTGVVHVANGADLAGEGAAIRLMADTQSQTVYVYVSPG